MSYVDCLHDREHDRIHVVERVQGKRVYREYPINYTFYYPDERGKFTSIFGTPVSRFSSRSNKEFRKELRLHEGKQLFESDLNPVFRVLEENYKNVDSPTLNVAFFDIETDFHPERGFAPTTDPFNAITAITVYLSWMDRLVTLAIPPKTLSLQSATEIANEFDNTWIFEREEDMLNTFLDIIDDADVLSGWNSEGFDIPYTVNRVTRVLSRDDTRRLCLWGQYPKERVFEKFGADQVTYDTVGRVHMDYMLLYRKYTYEERHSYALDAIGEHELNERKVAYEGTLDQLYNNDFRKFIEYNRQDTLLLHKLDAKLKFIDLANALAHDNTVLIQTTMGAVAVTDQAIINEAHNRGLVVPSRNRRFGDDESQAAGAYVANPKRGLHEWIGSVDINSLYPSVIRSLNMGPETIVGQLRPLMTDHLINERVSKGMGFAGAWEGLFSTLEYAAVMERRVDTEITVDWADGSAEVYSGAELWSAIFDSNRPWMLSANGTIFSHERKGIIPGLLERWYAERKELQAKKRDISSLEDGLILSPELAEKVRGLL